MKIVSHNPSLLLLALSALLSWPLFAANEPTNKYLEARLEALEKKVQSLNAEVQASKVQQEESPAGHPRDAEKLLEQLKHDLEKMYGDGADKSAPKAASPFDKAEKMRLGVLLAPSSPELAKHFHNDVKDAVFVIAVASGSPADKAGIKSGDAIVSFAEKRIATMDDLVAAVDASPDARVGLIVSRHGQQVGLTVDFGRRDAEPGNVIFPEESQSIGG